MFEPRFFEICPECRRKVNELGECQDHGKVVPDKRALLNFIMDDGTSSIRSVIFSDVLEKIMSKEELENQELFSIKKNDFLGKEMMITGQVRKNSMFGSNEFIVEEMNEVDVNKLIEKLEKD